MNTRSNKKIYRKCLKKGLHFDHVCEVGVYLPETSNVIDFIRSGSRATLVEADPETVLKIEEYFKDYQVRTVPVAVWDRTGTLRLSKAAASTFATELKQSPALINDHYRVTEENTIEVPCKVFTEIDDGTIDLLSIDIEGGEWYVLKYLKSSPKVISLETHGKYYTNPFIGEISNWMTENGYALWYKDASDSIFVRKEILKPSPGDQFETKLAELRISWKKLKRIFKRK